MQAIALRPGRSRLMAQLIWLSALMLLMLLTPALSLPVALVAPLFVCPLVGHSQQWWGFALALAPVGVSLYGGGDAAYSMSLALPCGLCALIARGERAASDDSAQGDCTGYIIAYAAALSVIVLLGARALGGGLSEGLASMLADEVGNSRGAGATLYKLASGGAINVPREYKSAQYLSYVLDPVLKAQLLMSLRLTLRLSLNALIPKLFVEVCIALGLFVYLRGQRLNRSFLLVRTHEVKGGAPTEAQGVPVTRSMGFMALELPQHVRGIMLIICLGSLMLPMASDSYLRMLGVMCDSAFQCVFKLIGAAVLISLFTVRKPELKTVFGALSAVAYALLPTVLALVGVIDQLLHFRRNTLFNQEEE